MRKNVSYSSDISAMQPDQQLLNQWSESAPFWEKHREIIRQMYSPVTQALLNDARIRSGHTVLDVATGTGEPALSVAGLTGPTGRVIGVDPVPEMVAAARRAADSLRLANVQFEVAPAEHLPFPEDTCDAVVSRFGVMFFPSPADAVREMLRVLKPGRTLAMAVWHLADRNPFHYILSRIIDRYVDSPPPAPDAREPFRYAEPGKLSNVLLEADASEVSERVLKFTIRAPVSVEDFWTLRCEMSLREKIAKLTREHLAEAKCQALEALREYSTDRGMSFPAEVLIGSATKGHGA